MASRTAVAIDGPSGAGKSTIAKVVAARLGFVYVDTGAIYRAVGLCLLEKGVDPRDAEAVGRLLPDITVTLRHQDGGQRVFLNGRDVTGLIRTPEVSACASDASALPAVRAFLFGLQRSIAENNDVVMDGRDIGTVILPDADVKIFLTATPEDRARRRYEELLERGQKTTYEETLKAVVERDRNDSTRAAAPLTVAPGAVVVDTTGNTLEKSVELICSMVLERLGR